MQMRQGKSRESFTALLVGGRLKYGIVTNLILMFDVFHAGNLTVTRAIKAVFGDTEKNNHR